MKKSYCSISFLILLAGFMISTSAVAQTVIPNPGFEDWITIGNYTNPAGWDTPNQELMSIPFLGFSVVTKSTDHHGTGNYSAKLETKHLSFPPLDVPGFMTCGTLTVDIGSASYILSGGVPVVDQPTHLKGFYKYLPKGGDTCLIGIGLTKTTGSVRDTVALGYFSTQDTVSDWAPFSAWINYLIPVQPDTMNIIAMSTAQEVMTPGTVLYVDDLYLDYTTGFDQDDPSAGISVYNDRESQRLLVFFDFPESRIARLRLYDIRGVVISGTEPEPVSHGRKIIDYNGTNTGIYILEINHDGQRYVKKIWLGYNNR